jgi:ketosteroid isomerase-like protein
VAAQAPPAGNPNLAALEGAYARWSSTKGGNAAEILDLFDDEVEMHSALGPDVPDAVAGVHLSRAGASDYFEGLLRDWEMLSYDVERFVSEGDTIVMIGRCAWRNRATDAVVDTPKIDVHTFNAAGRVVRFQEVYDTLGFARALGAV